MLTVLDILTGGPLLFPAPHTYMFWHFEGKVGVQTGETHTVIYQVSWLAS